jgi:hypothetical protein
VSIVHLPQKLYASHFVLKAFKLKIKKWHSFLSLQLCLLTLELSIIIIIIIKWHLGLFGGHSLPIAGVTGQVSFHDIRKPAPLPSPFHEG